MARYDDKATEDFVEALRRDEEPRRDRVVFREALGVAKDLAGGKPLPAAIARHTLTGATRGFMAKTAGFNTLKLYEILNENFGVDWWDWLPETLEVMTREVCGIDMDAAMKNTVMALQVVSKSNAPFEDWHVFEKVGQAFNENPVNFGSLQPLEPDEVAWTVKVLTTMRPQTHFEDEVLGYIAACAKHAGLVYLPANLFPSGSNENLDKMGNDFALKVRVISVWPLRYESRDPGKAALVVQLGRLHEVQDYVTERLQ